MFVSDEDEGAKADGVPVDYYRRLFEGLKGTGNENKVSVAAITGYPLATTPLDAPPVALADTGNPFALRWRDHSVSCR